MAEQTLVRQTSRNLDQTLTDTREQLLVQRYLRQKFWSKISVTRRDIERYYADHAEEFNPPPRRTLRLIYVTDEPAADQVDQMLREGVPFEQVAASSLNQYRPDQAGLMSQEAVGDQVFGYPLLNKAMLGLSAGSHSPRVRAGQRTWWIRVDAIERAAPRALNEVQLEIEQRLLRHRFQVLTQRYREELFATGSYNRIDLMADALIGVAVSRFAAVGRP